VVKSLMDDAFAHHVWANDRLIEAFLNLTDEQLARKAVGAYGSILETMRHIVGGDSFDIFTFTGMWPIVGDPATMDIAELRQANQRIGAEWIRLLTDEFDPDAIIKEVDPEDGFTRDATVGLRLAGALQHGSEHRSQICTTLTSLGLDPPNVSVWRFGVDTGRSVEVMPSSY